MSSAKPISSKDNSKEGWGPYRIDRGPYLNGIEVDKEVLKLPIDLDKDTIAWFFQAFKLGNSCYYRSIPHFLFENYYDIDDWSSTPDSSFTFEFSKPCICCGNSKLKNADGMFQTKKDIQGLTDKCIECEKNKEIISDDL